MFDETTLNRRDSEPVADPIPAMMAERERLHKLGADAFMAAREIEAALPDEVRNGVAVAFGDDRIPLSVRYKSQDDPEEFFVELGAAFVQEGLRRQVPHQPASVERRNSASP